MLGADPAHFLKIALQQLERSQLVRLHAGAEVDDIGKNDGGERTLARRAAGWRRCRGHGTPSQIGMRPRKATPRAAHAYTPSPASGGPNPATGPRWSGAKARPACGGAPATAAPCGAGAGESPRDRRP